MKRQTQQIGVRDWYGDALIGLQEEPLKVLDGFFGQFGNYIVSGCSVAANGSKYDISPGLVSLEGTGPDGKAVRVVAPFAGAASVSLPVYLSLALSTEEDQYNDGEMKPIAYGYAAEATGVKPSGSHIAITAAGAPRLTDVIQDALHRFITDAERATWNGTLASAKEYTNSVGLEIMMALTETNNSLSSHKTDSSNPHQTTKAQVGLGNVNNTSDADKPVSTAQGNALRLKLDVSQPVATGNMTLGGNLILKGAGNYGNKINFGDGDYVHISEPSDDKMELKASSFSFLGGSTEIATAGSSGFVFKGVPTAPTAASGTKSAQIATTEFVHNELVNTGAEGTLLSNTNQTLYVGDGIRIVASAAALSLFLYVYDAEGVAKRFILTRQLYNGSITADSEYTSIPANSYGRRIFSFGDRQYSVLLEVSTSGGTLVRTFFIEMFYVASSSAFIKIMPLK